MKKEKYYLRERLRKRHIALIEEAKLDDSGMNSNFHIKRLFDIGDASLTEMISKHPVTNEDMLYEWKIDANYKIKEDE